MERDRLDTLTMRHAPRFVFAQSDAGFSLVESVVAVFILSIGLLGLAAVFTKAIALGSAASADMIAKEKASEAIESLLAARDAQILLWDDIRNQGDGGKFVNGEQPLKEPGLDGIIGTADDAQAPDEMITEPGPDGQLGGGTDIVKSLSNYTREIRIQQAAGEGASLREIHVIIRYTYSGQRRQYELVSLISSYS